MNVAQKKNGFDYELRTIRTNAWIASFKHEDSGRRCLERCDGWSFAVGLFFRGELIACVNQGRES